MKTLLKIAVDNLRKHGYSATESNVIGYIDIQQPYVIRSGGGVVRTGFDTKSIHHMHVWKYINDSI